MWGGVSSSPWELKGCVLVKILYRLGGGGLDFKPGKFFATVVLKLCGIMISIICT